jgi:[protein]-arginine 3-hydroxylase / protease
MRAHMMQPTLPDPSLFQKPIAVERRESPTRAEFEKQYLSRSSRPVILTDVVSSWPAFRKWNFNFFAARYGDEDVIASDQLRSPTKMFRMKLRTLVNVCHPSGEPELAQSPRSPLYFGFQPFLQHPELIADFSQPSVVDCIYENSPGELYQWYVEHFGVILIGSAGTVTALHADLFGTHAWLAQICGRKHWLLFAPGDAQNLDGGKANLLQPDLAIVPRLQTAQPYEAIVEPGELIFVPQGWYHHVVSLDASISLSFNFVNQTNFVAHVLGISRDFAHWSKRIKSLEDRINSRSSGAQPDFEFENPVPK